MNSSSCLSMKLAYEEFKETIKKQHKELNDCSDDVANAIPCMEKIIINYQQIDNGKMSEFYTSLNTIKKNLEDIIKKCDEQIIYWEEKYQSALIAEAAAKAAANANDKEDINQSDKGTN